MAGQHRLWQLASVPGRAQSVEQGSSLAGDTCQPASLGAPWVALSTGWLAGWMVGVGTLGEAMGGDGHTLESIRAGERGVTDTFFVNSKGES